MTIARIGELHAKDGKGPDLLALLQEYLPAMRQSDGHIDYTIYVQQDDADRIVIVETWESIDAHQAAAAVIPDDAVNHLRELIAAPPSGDYFTLA